MRKFATVLLASMGSFTAISANAENLRLGDFQSSTHIVSVEGTQKWMKAVEEKTGGKITFTHFPAEQAAKADALLDAVKNGILDAALIGPIYNAEALPLNSVVSLPGFYTTAEQGTEALQEMMVDGPLRQELIDNGVVPIYSFVLPPYQVLSKEKRLGMPEDWKGLSIRTSGSTQAMIARDLGAAGVSIPGPEVYTAVERGRLDGVLFPLASVPGYNLQEVVKHISSNGAFGGYSFILVMRRDLFESEPKEIQDALTGIGAETAMHVAKAQDESVSVLTKEWAEKGIDVYQLTDDETTAINQAISSLRQEWLDRIGKRNPEAANVLSQYDAAVKD